MKSHSFQEKLSFLVIQYSREQSEREREREMADVGREAAEKRRRASTHKEEKQNYSLLIEYNTRESELTYTSPKEKNQ